MIDHQTHNSRGRRTAGVKIDKKGGALSFFTLICHLPRASSAVFPKNRPPVLVGMWACPPMAEC